MAEQLTHITLTVVQLAAGRWLQLRNQALAQPLRDNSAAYRAIREMLAKGTSDPYTRFITPQEFESMRKYDVTGVGLHLGTAEEFVRKTGLTLPAGHAEDEVSNAGAAVAICATCNSKHATLACGWACGGAESKCSKYNVTANPLSSSPPRPSLTQSGEGCAGGAASQESVAALGQTS